MNGSTRQTPEWILPYRDSITAWVGGEHFAEVLARWREPHRKFHTLTHLQSVIESFQPGEDALVLAALYHDAVYEPGRPDNEAESAALLHAHEKDAAIALGTSEKVHPAVIEQATRIILSTAAFQHKSDPGEERFFQADCQILLSDWPELLVYEEQIRSEFRNVPAKDYLSGRCDFLERASRVFPENADCLLRLRSDLLQQAKS